MSNFFNTTQETGRKLQQYEQSAATQEDKVMSIFKRSKHGLTASEVFQLYLDRRTPLTSIRRAINTLMNDKKLVKTNIKRPGMFGRPETEYQLYTGQMILFN